MNFENLSALGENASFVRDLSRYGNNGTARNNTFWNAIGGKYGGAYEFNNESSKYIEISSFNYSLVNEGGSVAFWLYYRESRTNDGFVTDDNLAFIAYDSLSKMRFIAQDLSSTSIVDINSGSLPLNAWTHWVFTWNTTIGVLYYNGVLNGTDTIVIGQPYKNMTKLFIGSERPGVTSEPVINGTIDELMIYNRTLSSAEIYQHYTAGAGRYMQ